MKNTSGEDIHGIALVYQLVPESTAVYLLDELSPSEVKKLKVCHNRYWNLCYSDFLNKAEIEDLDEAQEWLTNFLEDKTPIMSDSDQHQTFLHFNGKYELIITGFVL